MNNRELFHHKPTERLSHKLFDCLAEASQTNNWRKAILLARAAELLTAIDFKASQEQSRAFQRATFTNGN